MTKQPTEQKTATGKKYFYHCAKIARPSNSGLGAGKVTYGLHFTDEEWADMQIAQNQNHANGKMCNKLPAEAFIYELLTGKPLERAQPKPKAEKTTATADKTDAELRDLAYSLEKAGKTKTEIVLSMMDSGFTKDQIKTAFTSPPAEPTPEAKMADAEALLKEIGI